MKNNIIYLLITLFLLSFLSIIFAQSELNVSIQAQGLQEEATQTESISSDENGEGINAEELQSRLADSQTSPSPESSAIIKQLLGDSQQVEIGKESDEIAEPFKLFNTPEDVKRLLVKEPKFIYDPKRLPDPMIIPWVRDQLLATEKLDKAKQYFVSKEYESVLQICNDILENHKNVTGIVNQAQTLLDKTKKEITDAKQKKTIVRQDGEEKEIQVELPSAVRSGTKGILYSGGGKALALINDNIVAIGDEVPDNKGVFLEEIKSSGEVIFRYKGVLFPVTVKTLP